MRSTDIRANDWCKILELLIGPKRKRGAGNMTPPTVWRQKVFVKVGLTAPPSRHLRIRGDAALIPDALWVHGVDHFDDGGPRVHEFHHCVELSELLFLIRLGVALSGTVMKTEYIKGQE